MSRRMREAGAKLKGKPPIPWGPEAIYPVRPPVYLAGPFRGEPVEVVRNVQRACDLANYAVHRRFTPFVPHAMGFLSVHGPTEGQDERALACCTSMVRHLSAVPEARMWVILRDDRSLSEGTALEIEAWLGAPPVRHTWAEWQQIIGEGA